MVFIYMTSNIYYHNFRTKSPTKDEQQENKFQPQSMTSSKLQENIEYPSKLIHRCDKYQNLSFTID